MEGWEQLYGNLPTQKPVAPELFPTSQDDAEELITSNKITHGTQELEEQGSRAVIEDKSPMHYQYKGRFIMTAVKSGLMIIDQYRADVRIRYEQYMEQLRTHQASSQRVLFPEVARFSPSDAVMLQKILPELEAIGFELSDLGQYSYAINAIPAGLEGLDSVQLLCDMVSDAIEKGATQTDAIHAALALSMARHAAIPQGQVLSNEEMEAVVNQLFACSNVNYTPDGKAILCILPQRDIEQLLG